MAKIEIRIPCSKHQYHFALTYGCIYSLGNTKNNKKGLKICLKQHLKKHVMYMNEHKTYSNKARIV